MNVPKATIDFETRSACSLRAAGAWRYSLDSSTDILCLAFRLPHWKSGVTALWTPELAVSGHVLDAEAWGQVGELLDWIDRGGLVEAHNAFFERAVWTNILSPRYGFPLIPPQQYRCSAAKAAAHALPRGLDDALKALGLKIGKDAAGGKVMMKMTKPRKPRKAEREAWAKQHGSKPHPTLWWETADLWPKLFAYCRQDVLAEHALSSALNDLSPDETELYILDQTINGRGFQLDIEAVDTALDLIKHEVTHLNRELGELTQGRVKKATQRAQMKAWFADNDLSLPDTQKETIAGVLERSDLAPHVRRALLIVKALGRSSTAKYEKMQQHASPVDGRVRGGLLFHGATTGRWSGSGVQPHNFPKGTRKDMKDVDRLWAVLKQGRPAIMASYGDVMEALSHALRGAITAGPGKVLYVADYSSIEARIVMWLANDQEALEVFRSGRDIYCEMGREIYHREIVKGVDEQERNLSKAAVLGLGFGMGATKFIDSAATYKVTIDQEFSQLVVDTFRTKFWRVKNMWTDQENAAIRAVESPGALEVCGPVLWEKRGRFLYCTLPSGRLLSYPDAVIRMRETPWGAMKPSLTFKGVDQFSHKWTSQITYGAKLVENITQAVARDILAHALLACERSGVYLPTLSVHDESVCEGDASAGLAAFEKLMTTSPDWADGLPVAVDAWTGFRYKKG